MKNVRFLELHTELFHAGKNFGKKLIPTSLLGMTLQWDEKEKWFEITWNGRKGYIFMNNCAFWEELDEVIVELPKNEHRTEALEGRRRAQHSTPMDHVFEGKGHGKVRQ